VENRYFVEAVHRAALVCAAFDDDHCTHDLTSLSRRCEIPQRTLVRIVETLARRDFLLRDAGGRIRLGPRWLSLARAKAEGVNIRDIAVHVMRDMREKLDETYILGIRHGDSRIITECLISTQPVRRMSFVGFETPLHVGSGGRAIMSRMTDVEIEDYLSTAKLENVGFDTVRDLQRIRADIEKARRNGYLTARAEITQESFSCSAPILDHTARVVASFTITLPLVRLDGPLETKAIAFCKDGARRISEELGHTDVR
jgi:IclR family KDG regulon transcriptional repressor